MALPTVHFQLWVLTAALALASGCGRLGYEAVQELTCGEGTVEQDGQCVLGTADAAPGVGMALQIVALEPAVAFIGGGDEFVITGNGFLAPGAAGTSISFGNAPVQTFFVDSDTRIRGLIPAATAREVTVTLANGNGAATAAFSYVGLYAADGKGGIPGNLYLIDPRNGAALAIGPIQSGASAPGGHAIGGLAFAADGTLFATEVTARGTGTASLLMIDPDTGAATVVGPLDDSKNANYGTITDITFAGSALIGWNALTEDNAVAIDTATGAVTVMGPSGIATYGSGMATLASGTVVLAGDSIAGVLSSINTTTGAAAPLVTLGGSSFDTRPNSMTVFRGALFAILNGEYSGSSITALAAIDPGTGQVEILGLTPGGLEALASDEPTIAAMGQQFARPLGSATLRAGLLEDAPCVTGRRGSVRVIALGGAHALLAGLDLGAHPAAVPVSARRPEVSAVPLQALQELRGASAVEVTSCGGATRTLATSARASGDAGYQIVQNRRGRMKIVDASGKALLRNVVQVRAVGP
jgi:hypothetical protein